MHLRLIYFADIQVLRQGIKLARSIGDTEPLKDNMLVETWPGPDVETDQQWEDWLRGQVFTEFHPSSTCSMLPLEQGGVVDANLRVYGLSNVRVADASVPPIAFSAHLMSSTYGIAEQASTIIRAFYNISPSTKTNSTSGHGSGSSNSTGGKPPAASSSGNSSAGSSTKANGSNGGLSVHTWTLFIAVTVGIASKFLLDTLDIF